MMFKKLSWSLALSAWFVLGVGTVALANEPIASVHFEDTNLTKLVDLMDTHLLDVTCAGFVKYLTASTYKYQSIRFVADADICKRNDLPEEGRPYFRSLILDAKAEYYIEKNALKFAGMSFRAKFPINYSIPDSGTIAFFNALGDHIQQTSLREFEKHGEDHISIKDRRGDLIRWYRNGALYFRMRIHLEPGDVSKGESKDATIMTLETNYDA